jgi:hypothetical protein
MTHHAVKLGRRGGWCFSEDSSLDRTGSQQRDLDMRVRAASSLARPSVNATTANLVAE